MPEFFVMTNSFAAPFFSDPGDEYVDAETPTDALEKAAATYTHPMGLYAAVCYTSADAHHKGEKPLATWLCNHEREKRRLAEGRAGYSYLGHSVGDFEIDGVRHTVPNPRAGSVLP